MEKRRFPDPVVTLLRGSWVFARKDSCGVFTATWGTMAISGQVHATALVYDALRLAQAEIAQKVGVEPERLSPEKPFPCILENMVKLT